MRVEYVYVNAKPVRINRTTGTIQRGRAAISANAFLGSMNTPVMRPTSPNGGAAFSAEGSGVIRIGSPNGRLYHLQFFRASLMRSVNISTKRSGTNPFMRLVTSPWRSRTMVVGIDV